MKIQLQLLVASALACGTSCVQAQTQQPQMQQPQMQGQPVGQVQPQTPWKIAPGPLLTRWSKEVSPQNVLPEYPRPQMARKNWQSLNGVWSLGLSDASSTSIPAQMNGQIMVPFPFESALSGIGKPSPTTQKSWYRRTFSVPAAWKNGRVLLHFGAANYQTNVSLNGQSLGSHKGGYDSFDFDISPQLKQGENELVVSVTNPISTDVENAQVEGKQRVHPGSIFYTGATGIWQSVWLEPVPVAHIAELHMTPYIDRGLLSVGVRLEGQRIPFIPDRANTPIVNPLVNATAIRVEAFDAGKRIARLNSRIVSVGWAMGRERPFWDVAVSIPNAKLWSPESPFLYDLKVTLLNGDKEVDSVNSYFAMRKISLVKDARGRTVLGLNNKPYFQVGVLDQGYWPDGIYTAPTDEALRFDIETAKNLGWNLLRKHAKVEPARWYYYADKIGMLVWQDMPQMYGGPNGALTQEAKDQFDLEWREIIRENFNSPSIVVWTTFNEGMGQHDTERVVANTRALDSSRLVNNASGWVDKNVGDMHDSHVYPGPGSNEPEPFRAAVNGEFGGITFDAGHRWENNANVMGYGATLKSSWPANKRFQDLMRAAYRLRDERGTSAVVYTQLTDVEQEINGVLTYDRAVTKMDARIVAAANRGQFLPLPPNPDPQLVPTSEEEPLNWQYTFEQPGADWTSANFNAANWKTGPAPFGHDAGGVRTPWSTSDIWIRRAFTLPQQIPTNLNLLVNHDEETQIFINGVLAASVTGYNNTYAEIPMSAQARASLKPGQNVMAVHVHQTIGGQFIDVDITAAK